MCSAQAIKYLGEVQEKTSKIVDDFFASLEANKKRNIVFTTAKPPEKKRRTLADAPPLTDYKRKSPGLRIKSPGIKSPGLRIKSPGLRIKSPRLRIKSPRLRIKSPGIKSPGIRIKPIDIRAKHAVIRAVLSHFEVSENYWDKVQMQKIWEVCAHKVTGLTSNKFFEILKGLPEFTTRNADGSDITIHGRKFVAFLRPKVLPQPQTAAKILLFNRMSGSHRVLANNSYEDETTAGMSVMLDHVWYLTESHAIEAKKFEAAAAVADGERREALLRHSGKFQGLNPFFSGSINQIKEAGRRINLNIDEMKEVRRHEVDVQTRICMFKMTQSRLVRRVLATSIDQTLVFENSANSFWGAFVTSSNEICGKNKLGKIWMDLRQLL